MIDIVRVSKEYRFGRESFFALANISVQIEDGEYVAILGPSGSGKSTLMHLIGGLDRPTEGDLIVDNENLSELNDGELAEFRNKKVGFIFQSFNLIPNTSLYDNVSLPLVYSKHKLPDEKEKIRGLIDSVGLSHKTRNKPSQLSGGEQQRVAIARSLINDPQIILADEPTGNLDSKNGTEVMKILKNLNKKGKTVIIVTHDQELAKETDRVIRLRDGKII